MQQLFNKIKAQLESKSDFTRAEAMAAYMRHQFVYYGVNAPQRKAIQSELFPIKKTVSIAFLEDFVKKCWEQDQREWKYVALDFSQKMLAKGQMELLELFEGLIANQSWWDTVDSIAPNLLGRILLPYPELKLSKMKDWIERDNFWYQRSAIILQLKYRLQTDFDQVQALILRRSSSKEFFIQKASGWALREYSKYNPAEVIKFIESNTLSPLTKKEGMKWIRAKEIHR